MDKIRYAADYQKQSGYPFPNELNPVKDQGYFLSALNAMASKFFMNRCALPYDGWGVRRSFAELRAYRHGRNNINKYKNWMIGMPDQSGQRKTTLNISWGMAQILPQKCDAVLGYLMKNNFDINIQASDYEALTDKKTKVAAAKVLTDLRLGNMLTDLNQNHTINLAKPAVPSNNNSVPIETPEDVDLAQAIGLFMLEEEAALENLIQTTQYISKSTTISDLIADDLITTAYAAKRVFTNPNTGEVEEAYIDIEWAVFPDSKYRDYHDITWGGWMERITIGELRRTTDIPTIEIIKIAKKYADTNTGSFYSSLNSNNDQFDFRMVDQILVDVFRGYWIGNKGVRMTEITRKDGNLSVNKVGSDYLLSRKDQANGKRVNEYSNMTIYKASMILGCGYTFDYGEDTDINYKTDKGRKWPLFPLRFVRTGSSSIVERSVELIDDFQLNMLKLRVARAKMPAPPNLAIDKGALEGMKIDGVSYKPQQLLKILQDEGYLLMDTKNQWGQAQNSSRPITPIGTDLMSIIDAWWRDSDRILSTLDRVTGINDIFAAQQPQRETGLGVSKILLEGSQNSLTPLINCTEQLTQGAAEVMVGKWQVVAKYATPEQKKKLSISRSLQIVSVSEKIFDYQFDVQTTIARNDADKERMLEDLLQMRNAARAGGVQSMNEQDYLIIENLIRSDKLKQAEIYTAFAITKRQKQAQQEQQQMIALNAQAQQQSAGQKGQIDSQLQQQDTQQQAALDNQKYQAQLRQATQIEIMKGINRQNEIRLQAYLNPKKSA
jgi:hypothetical protein